MSLELQGFIDLPPHVGQGAFDHAAVHTASGRCYVAHTANDAIDVIDLVARKYVGSIPGLTAPAGALVTEAPDFVFTSNRGEDTVGIFTPANEMVEKVGVGVKPNGNVPHAGAHGLDIDVAGRRLFCACDASVLLELDADSGETLATVPIAGTPDVVFFNAALGRVYVAIGDPGVIEVFDTSPLRRHETVTTESGAHTLAFDATRNIVCAFLPETHRAALHVDRKA